MDLKTRTLRPSSSTFTPTAIVAGSQSELIALKGVSPELLSLTVIREGTMSGTSLWRYVDYLKRSGLDGMAERLVDMSLDERTKLPGVSRGRAQQLPAAAVVAQSVMDAFGIDAFELCPWALREGMILQYLDAMPVQHHRA